MAREEDIRQRFEREAQVCARVKHENIVDIYSYRADADATFLVMEFVQGESLGDLLKRQGRIDWQVALAMLAGVLKGLAHAHAKGVYHRDIKPDNLLVSEDGRIKITDFGLATIADSSRMTVQDAVVGTPAYLPPEQVSGGKFDLRGDLFSVGVTFYESLTGTSPFSGQSFSETLKKVLTYSPPPPSTLIPEIPPEFDQILAHLLEKQPSRRAGSADIVLEEVKKLAQMKNVHLESLTVAGSLVSGPNGSSAKLPVSLPSSHSQSMQRIVPVWAFGITIALLAMMIFLIPNREALVGDGLPKLKNSVYEQVRESIDAARQAGISAQAPVLSDDANKKAVTGRINDGSPSTNRTELPKPTEKEPLAPGKNPAKTENVINPNSPGKLMITCRPWAFVTIDNTPYGQTPLTGHIELLQGDHSVTLTNPEFPTPFTTTITIKPDEVTNLDANLWDIVGVIQIISVKPWAEIVVDGISYGLTPRAKPILVPFGNHIIELRNGDFQTWRQEIELTTGNKVVEVNVQLEALPK